jgi:hypothetical protein
MGELQEQGRRQPSHPLQLDALSKGRWEASSNHECSNHECSSGISPAGTGIGIGTGTGTFTRTRNSIETL